MSPQITAEIQSKFSQDLIDWYSVHGRKLPFRETKNPYHVWVSEIIFQQTRISQGMDHYLNFVQKFPDVKALAQAEDDELMHAWKGLGYYSRALNIRKAALKIMELHGGEFPTEYNQIIALPGIGPYTAAAICSICFGQKFAVVDGNVYRVLSRLLALECDISSYQAHSLFQDISNQLMGDSEPGTYNQAIMDLGATVCTPKNPQCHSCPSSAYCIAKQEGRPLNFPVKTKKIKTSKLAMTYYFIFQEGDFLVSKRNAAGIWKNLYQFLPEDTFEQGINFDWKTIIKHKLTHKDLEITIKVKEMSLDKMKGIAKANELLIMHIRDSEKVSFPKPFQTFLTQFYTAESQPHLKSLFLPNE